MQTSKNVGKQGRDNSIKTVQYTTSLHTIICVLGIRMHIFASRRCADYARASYAVAQD